MRPRQRNANFGKINKIDEMARQKRGIQVARCASARSLAQRRRIDE